MRKLAWCLAAIAIATPACAAPASKDAVKPVTRQVYVDNSAIGSALELNGMALMPVRLVAGALGATVTQGGPSDPTGIFITSALPPAAPTTIVRPLPPRQVRGADTLKGIKHIILTVVADDPRLESAGIGKSWLQTYTELQLRKAGIDVVDQTIYTPDTAILDVEIVLVKPRADSPLNACDTSVSVLTPVVASRDKSMEMSAVVWQDFGAPGIVGDEAIGSLKNDITGRIDSFLNDYLTANPISRP